MATNEHFRQGDKVSLPVPAGTKAGQPLRIGSLNAVAVTDRANTSVSPTNNDGTVNSTYNYGGGNPDGQASCWLNGCADFVVGFSANPGDPIYIDSSNALQSTASGNSLYGHSLSTKGATSGPLAVRLTN